MKIHIPLAAASVAAVFASTAGLTATVSAQAETAKPDIEQIPLTDISDSGIEETGARETSAASATVTNQSGGPTVNTVPGAFAAQNTSLGSTGESSAGSEGTAGESGTKEPQQQDPENSGAHENTAPAQPSPESTPTEGVSGAAKDKTEDGATIASLSDVLSVPSSNPSIVGISYSGQAQATFEVRTQTGGAWTNWTQLEVDNTGEGKSGTEPYVVNGASQVQLRVLGDNGAPAGTELILIDPKKTGSDTTAVANNSPVMPGEGTGTGSGEDNSVGEVGNSSATTDGSGDDAFGATNASAAGAGSAQVSNVAADVSAPKIASRKDWGANESWRKGSPSYASKTKATIIHHTAGTNNYKADDVPGILRGIYSFHTKGRGWSDVGYNVLIDKYGRAWQGRGGDIKKAIIGAHAANFNTGTLGISVMGSYGKSAPSKEALNTLAHVIAWKFAQDKIDPNGKVTINGRKINTIAGHRNVGSTECPGDAFYAKFGEIRQNVAKIMKDGAAQTSKQEQNAPKQESSKSQTKPSESPIQKAYKGQEAALGKPVGKEEKFGTGVVQKYEKGFIAYSDKTGVQIMTGAIAQAWPSVRDKIGLPNGRVGTLKKGVYQSFEKGAMHWSKSTGAYATKGAIWTYWKSKGFERGHLGYPKSNEATDNGQIIQRFEGATLVWTPQRGVLEYSPNSEVMGGATDNNAQAPATKQAEKTPEAKKTDKNTSSKSKKTKAESETELRNAIIKTAQSELGTPYVWGGTSPKTGWDCSAYVQWVYGKHGIKMPRTTGAQRNVGKVISAKNAKPGDLIWIPGHIGIVSETSGMMYDAGSKRTGTSKRSYNWMLKNGAKFIRVVGN